MHPRLFLIAPDDAEAGRFVPQLESALAGGDVACLLLTAGARGDGDLQKFVASVVPLAQAAGTAVLVQNDTHTAGRSRSDGVHIDTGVEDLKLALGTFKPTGIVGAGAIRSRHDAMELAEAGVDYVFFGRLDFPEDPEPHPKTVALAEWWAELFEIPCVAFGGSDIGSLATTARTGADFVALRRAIWNHPDGPEAAVRSANETLMTFELATAED